MELKTSNVAKRLGVSTKTVQRWVRKYNIPCQKNEAGHYVFDAETIALLEQIKFEHGATLEEYETDMDEGMAKDTVCPELFFDKHVKPHLEEMTSRLQAAERKIEQKADDVVSFQILQHRKEIEELTVQIQQLEQRLAQLEQANHNRSLAEQDHLKKTKRRGLGRIISLFI